MNNYKYLKTANFYGVSAHKIFRDLIYSSSGFQREDDRYYKKNGLYDFPTRDYKTRFRNLMFKILNTNKAFKEKFNQKINVLILEQLEKEIK